MGIEEIRARNADRQRSGKAGYYPEHAGDKAATGPVEPCAYARPLSAREREEFEKSHARVWNWCDHPQDGRGRMNGRIGLPLAKKIVCPCEGCGPTCPGYETEPVEAEIVIDHSGTGIGDGLLGLCVAQGLREESAARVRYRVGTAARPFVALFDGWKDVGTHVRPHGEKPTPGARQLNIGYTPALADGTPFIDRYCRNAGVKTPSLPQLDDPTRLLALGKEFAGRVVLAPFASEPARTYPLESWLKLEKALREAGLKTVAVHSEKDGLGGFSGEKLIGARADVLTGVMLNAAVVIGCDSGPAHLAGIVGRPTVVLCGYIRGEHIYGFYPDVVTLNSVPGYWPVPEFVTDLVLQMPELDQ